MEEEKMIAHPTIGVFAGIFNREGCILLKRREKDESLPGDWDLPGGGVEEEKNVKALDERVIGDELRREVEEEIGIILPPLQSMQAMYPAVISGGEDWAFGIPIGIINEKPRKGEWRYFSPAELEDLARQPEGNRLVGGPGKRMHRLALQMLASRDCPNEEYRRIARRLLNKYQSKL
ncbi:MAG TPA: NUDIX domain-containing protein [Candidatus Pacearchaeota archaeon]|nr:NUDIX domain-containing protein [Candidatus Pacearchaeota archaeon]HQK58467.1 NUDIX domain-containing protein [Candidatus Pacearchaeota archaeon]